MSHDNNESAEETSAGEKNSPNDDVSTRKEIDESPHSAGGSPEPDREFDSEDLGEELEQSGQSDLDSDEALLAELVEESPELRRRVRQAISRKYSGPIPPPEAFERYEDVYPGSAKIILGMAADTSAASSSLVRAEAKRIETNAEIDSKTVPRGQIISGLLTFGVLALAALSLFLDNAAFAFIFGGGGVVLMVMTVVPTLMQSIDNKSENKEIAES